MGCAATFAKWMLGLFNFALAILGAVIIYYGTAVFMKEVPKWVGFLNDRGLKVEEWGTPVEITVKYLPMVVIGIGAFLVATAALGICGAVFRNCCALCFFACILVLLMLITAAIGGLFLYVENSKQIKHGEDQFIDGFLKHYNWNDRENKTTIFVDTMQWNHTCCGVRKYTDWDSVRPQSLPKDEYPKSCCAKDNEELPCKYGNGTLHESGCLAILAKLRRFAKTAGIAIVVVAGIQLLVVILSYALMCSRNADTKNESHEAFAMQRQYPRDNYAFYHEK